MYFFLYSECTSPSWNLAVSSNHWAKKHVDSSSSQKISWHHSLSFYNHVGGWKLQNTWMWDSSDIVSTVQRQYAISVSLLQLTLLQTSKCLLFSETGCANMFCLDTTVLKAISSLKKLVAAGIFLSNPSLWGRSKQQINRL